MIGCGTGTAVDIVWGYAIGNDLTRRDIQVEAKKTRAAMDYGQEF
ncbi:fumarylacetoacetate hydrolase family protein [Shinella sp.]